MGINLPNQINKSKDLPHIDTHSEKEEGVILLIVLVILFALSVGILALLALHANNNIVASNLAVQSAAMEAADTGINDASSDLESLPAFPEVLAVSDAASLSPWYVPLPAGQNIPTTPTSSYWNTCASNNTCQVENVTYGAFHFTVEFYVQPTNLPAATLNGSQTAAATVYRYYTAFVHTQNTNGGGLGVTINAMLRKEQP